MNEYNYYNQPQSTERTLASRVSSVMKRVYFKMFLALLVTAFTALFCASSVGYISFLLSNSWFMWVLIIAEFGIVISLSGAINKISSMTASLLFYVFAVVNGMMLTTIFLAYAPGAIVKTFFITAGTFGAMSVFGYLTSQDLSKFGSFLTMALIGLVIAIIVNLFLRSTGLDWLISVIGVFIFVGLTAWDTQQVKNMAMVAPADSIGKLAVFGALSLYLDFINLFLFLLRIFDRN